MSGERERIWQRAKDIIFYIPPEDAWILMHVVDVGFH